MTGDRVEKIRNYRDLEVWQLGMKIARDIFNLTTTYPKEQNYVLVQQMQRAALSIPSNIAEGYGRNSLKEYIQFLSIALGSRAELETQLILSVDIGYADKGNARLIMKDLISLSKMLKKLLNTLKAKNKPSPVTRDL